MKTLPLEGNRWDLVNVPAFGAWSPSIHLTVVIPYHERPGELKLTLAGLAAQSYPVDLTEIIVVDDGSDVVPDVSYFTGETPIKVVSQSRDGFGLARARNLGVRESSGEVVVFLDCDMVPERRFLEAHARWHQEVPHAAVFGFRKHVEFEGLTAAEIGTAVAGDVMERLMNGRDVSRPEWIEGHMQSTNNLLDPQASAFLIMSGGNLSVRRELFDSAGGTDESFHRWGGEDTELGFRLMQAGALVVPEREALCWHQGAGQEPSDGERRSLRLQQPKLRNLIADPSFRKAPPSTHWQVPMVEVTVDGTDAVGEAIAATVESILGGSVSDLVLRLILPTDPDELSWVADRFGHEPLVELGPANRAPGSPDWAVPIRVRVPAGVILGEETISIIATELFAGDVVRIFGTIEQHDPTVSRVTGRLIRFERRAALMGLSATIEDPRRVGKERWLSGAALGLIFDQPTMGGPQFFLPKPGTSSGRATKPELTLAELRQYRASQFADALGLLVKARSLKAVRSAMRYLLSALAG